MPKPPQKLKHCIPGTGEGWYSFQDNEADTRELRAFLKLGSDLTATGEYISRNGAGGYLHRLCRSSCESAEKETVSVNVRRHGIPWEEEISVPVSGALFCDLWEGEQVNVPPHSYLYHLVPIGVRSPDGREPDQLFVPSRQKPTAFTSARWLPTRYLPRLNQSHLYRNDLPVYDHMTRFWKQSAVLNGTSATSSDWVQGLEGLTLRRDLRFLTMLTFEDVLSSRGLLRRTQAWCPACYEQWREEDQIIYQPLLWALEVIQVCPRHGLLLQLRCPYADCGQALSALAPRSQIGFCPHCERWAGKPSLPRREPSKASVSQEHEWQQWAAAAIGELLAAAPDFPASPHQELIAAAITTHVQTVLGGNFSALARLLRVHRRTAWEWGRGQQVPQLPRFRPKSLPFHSNVKAHPDGV